MKPSLFKSTVLGDVLKFFNGKSIKPGGDGEYPVYGSNGLIGQSDEYTHQNGLIIGRVGAYCGAIKYCKAHFWASDNTIVGQPKDTSFDIRYIYYLLKDLSLNHYAGGSAQPLLTQTVLRQVSTLVPPLPIQRKIATVLSAYDDLIENNTHRIEILEEMARAIYREWFVEFRFPGHEQVEMVESELGLIPQGWEVKFSDYVDFKEGPGLRRWQYRDSGIPFLNIRTLVDNDIDLSKVQYLDQDEVERKYSHFLLQSYDHVVSSSGTIGRIVTIQQHHLPLMLNTSIIRMRAKTENVGLWQLKHFLKSDYFQNQIHTLATGVAQKNYGPSHLKQMSIIVPDVEIGRSYETIVKPMEELIGQLVMKNTNLRQSRDLLLLKLISGEIDISELGINVSESK